MQTKIGFLSCFHSMISKHIFCGKEIGVGNLSITAAIAKHCAKEDFIFIRKYLSLSRRFSGLLQKLHYYPMIIVSTICLSLMLAHATHMTSRQTRPLPF